MDPHSKLRKVAAGHCIRPPDGDGRPAVNAYGNRRQLFERVCWPDCAPLGGQPQKCERRVDLAFEDFVPGRPRSEDQFLVRIAQ
jgi:hypothetical protein